MIGSRYQRAVGPRQPRLHRHEQAASLTTSLGLTREDNDRIRGDQSLDGVVTNAIGMQPMRPVYGDSYGYGGTPEGLRYSNPVAIANIQLRPASRRCARSATSRRNYQVSDQASPNGARRRRRLGVDELAWASPKVDRTLRGERQRRRPNGPHDRARSTSLEGFAAAYDAAQNDRADSCRVIGGASVEYNQTRPRTSSAAKASRAASRRTSATRRTITEWDGSATDNNLVGFFSRADWSLPRPLPRLSASLRADGSSRFGEDNRYGTLPGGLGGVGRDRRVVRAAACSGSATLKLRASYGATGNQGIGDFARLSARERARRTAARRHRRYRSSAIPTSGGRPRRSSTPAPTCSMLDGRVSLIADYYNRKTSDLLVQRPIPSTTGFTTSGATSATSGTAASTSASTR